MTNYCRFHKDDIVCVTVCLCDVRWNLSAYEDQNLVTVIVMGLHMPFCRNMHSDLLNHENTKICVKHQITEIQKFILKKGYWLMKIQKNCCYSINKLGSRRNMKLQKSIKTKREPPIWLN